MLGSVFVSACSAFGGGDGPEGVEGEPAPPDVPSADGGGRSDGAVVEASGDAGADADAPPCTCGGTATFCTGFEEPSLGTCWSQVERGADFRVEPAPEGGHRARIAAPFADVARTHVSVRRTLPAFTKLACSFRLELTQDTFAGLLRVAELHLRDGNGAEDVAIFFVGSDAVEAGVFSRLDGGTYRSQFAAADGGAPSTVRLEVVLGPMAVFRAEAAGGSYVRTIDLDRELTLDPAAVTAELVLGAIPTSTPDGGDNGDFDVRFDDVRCDVIR